MIARARRLSYWHSETVSGHILVDRCPWCYQTHHITLYVADNHDELPHWDFLNGLRTPCGRVVDVILERTMEPWVPGPVGRYQGA